MIIMPRPGAGTRLGALFGNNRAAAISSAAPTMILKSASVSVQAPPR
jgi:hypothetical protein